jgi:hypothetical protein
MTEPGVYKLGFLTLGEISPLSHHSSRNAAKLNSISSSGWVSKADESITLK